MQTRIEGWSEATHRRFPDSSFDYTFRTKSPEIQSNEEHRMKELAIEEALGPAKRPRAATVKSILDPLESPQGEAW